MKKIKFLLIVLLLSPCFFTSSKTEAALKVPDWFYVYVDVTNFPTSAIGWYAIIEITNTDLTPDYYAAYGNTVVYQDMGESVKVYVYPDEASVKFRLSGAGGSYNGTVSARVTVYTPEDYSWAGTSGSYTGQFYYNTNVPHITVGNNWIFE